MKKLLLLAGLFLFCTAIYAQKIKVACVGNSITFGRGLGGEGGEEVVAVVLHGPFRVCSVCHFVPAGMADRGAA